LTKVFSVKIFIVILQYTNNKIMGITKTESFTETQNELAVLLKALGHPARIAIVEYLLKVNTCICGDIVNELPLAQATISQHLKELKNAKLIKGNIEGTSVCYCLDEQTFEKIRNFMDEFLKVLKSKNGCC
jgi:DNA-binding transcriptional ArsR family regulator